MNKEHSVENYVDWLNEFIIGLNLSTPPILLGHSFGSVIVAHYAVKYPETISKLIVVNPIGSSALKGPKVITTKMTLFYYWLAGILPDRMSRWLLSTRIIFPLVQMAIIKTKDKAILSYIYKLHVAYSKSYANMQVVNESLKASILHTVREVANQITTPTLIIAGELDDITPLSRQYELAKMIKNCEITVINGVGHLTQYETPNAVADAIKNYLS